MRGYKSENMSYFSQLRMKSMNKYAFGKLNFAALKIKFDQHQKVAKQI